MVDDAENGQKQTGPHQPHAGHQPSDIQHGPVVMRQQSVGHMSADHPENRIDDVRNGRQTQTVTVPAQIPRQIRGQPLHYDVRGPVHGEMCRVDGPQRFAQDEVRPAYVARDDFGAEHR